MHNHVALQFALVTEAASTLLARERLCASVYQYVLPKPILEQEPFMADFALVRQMTVAGFNVDRQRAPVKECLAANITRAVPFPVRHVDFAVDLQPVGAFEDFAASRACQLFERDWCAAFASRGFWGCNLDGVVSLLVLLVGISA